MKKYVLLIACGAIFFSHDAFALRASRVESAAVTSQGEIHAEFGHRTVGQSAGVRIQQESMTLSAGIDGRQQIDLILPWRVHHTADSHTAFGDVGLMYKMGSLGVWDNGHTLAGLYQITTFPTSEASRVGKNNYRFDSCSIITRAVGSTTLTANFGSVYQTNGPALMRYGAGFEHAWKKIALFSEILGFSDLKQNGKNEIVTGSGGLEFGIGKHLTLDVGGEGGITKDAPSWGGFAGATAIF